MRRMSVARRLIVGAVVALAAAPSPAAAQALIYYGSVAGCGPLSGTCVRATSYQIAFDAEHSWLPTVALFWNAVVPANRPINRLDLVSTDDGYTIDFPTLVSGNLSGWIYSSSYDPGVSYAMVDYFPGGDPNQLAFEFIDVHRVAAAPEPATFVLLAPALLVIGAVGVRSRRRAC